MRDGAKAGERGATIGVEADVFPVDGRGVFIAIEGDGGAREVERPAIDGGHHFYGVRVALVGGGTQHLERSDLDVRPARRGGAGARMWSGSRSGSSPWMLT